MKAKRADFLELSQEILDRGAALRFRALGASMHPFIDSGDILVVEPVHGTHLSIGDVIFYRRSDGALTAHRLVRIDNRKGSKLLITKGDSLDYFDQPLSPEQVLGKVTSIERDGHCLRLDSTTRRTLYMVWARLSSQSRRFRPVVRPVWKLFRKLSPAVISGFFMSTVQGIIIYRRIAGLFRSGIEIREASEEDLQEVNAFISPGQPELPTTPDISFSCFVARKHNRVIGSVELVRRPEKYHPYDGYWLSSLKVKPAYRGIGIGKELSRKVMARSREEGLKELYLMVREDNHPAVKLYHKLGFKITTIPSIEEQLEKERHSLGYRYIIMQAILSEFNTRGGF